MGEVANRICLIRCEAPISVGNTSGSWEPNEAQPLAPLLLAGLGSPAAPGAVALDRYSRRCGVHDGGPWRLRAGKEGSRLRWYSTNLPKAIALGESCDPNCG